MSTLWQRMERERLRQKRAELKGARWRNIAFWQRMELVTLAALTVVLAVVGLLAGH